MVTESAIISQAFIIQNNRFTPTPAYNLAG